MIGRACCVLLSVLGLRASAFPISPQTLWDLTSRSSLIAVAQVGESRPQPRFPTTYKDANDDPIVTGDRLVQLRVLHTLAGPKLGTVQVATSEGIVCPAPARFEPGARVLVFLEQDGAQWRVVGRSYGTLYPSDAELPAYLAAVRSALALQHGSGPTPAQLQEWFVAAAQSPATRWHGLYPLASALDDLAFYDRRGSRPPPELSSAQRKRLAKAFIKAPTTDTTLGMTLALLREENDPALDAAFVGAFETALAHGDASAYELLPALRLLLERFAGTGDVEALLGPADAYDPDLTETDLEKAWRAARERFPLPRGREVAPRLEPHVHGTGSDTPF